MKLNTEGLILTEYDSGERDKYLVVLTRDKGVIRCFAKGAKSFKSQKFFATHQMSYSRLSVYCGSSYIIDEAEPIRVFFDCFKDIVQLSLAQYLCELTASTVPENTPASDQLDLLLNCLYVLSENKRSFAEIKTVFELRLLSITGNPPNILYCSGCGCYQADKMYFDYARNELICASCSSGGENLCELSAGALTAMRYIILAEPKKIFSFRISDKALQQLGDCTEKYTLSVTECRYKSLEFYRSMCE